jgi:peptide/nickel transport system substrate-binding protein
VVVVFAAGVMGSLSLLAHLGVTGIPGSATTPVVRGGTWVDDFYLGPDSLIPNGGSGCSCSAWVDQALYLPLFYGDAQGVVHPGAAVEVPTLQNGGISPDAKTWTFHLRPHLVWSDGQPYDARDVDYTWKLWQSPKFGAASTVGFNLISSADVSADHLAITFHLTRPYVPFRSLWVDGYFAPLPAHHFSAMAPEAILKSPDNLNPQVTSGPFMMAESLLSDHHTLVRNPRYYRASEGLPYLDKVVFHIAGNADTVLKDLQAGSIDSAWFPDVGKVPPSQRLTHYSSITPPTSASFEALYFNFHNTILASHLEVRQAIAYAIDHQALIQGARHGLATPLCTDHGSFYHPGYEATALCPDFNPAAANQLLDDTGWVRGPDGVRTRGGERLEFEYSTARGRSWGVDGEVIIARNLQAIGIKLDIQNYPPLTFFSSFLPGGKASPPTGAVAGRYDIAEFESAFAYDADDSTVAACNQFPSAGFNIMFYCNPALDALYQQEQATLDPGLRQQTFVQIHNIYLTEFPFIVLYSTTENWMVRKGTHNYQPSPIAGDTVNIWQWWCDKEKC